MTRPGGIARAVEITMDEASLLAAVRDAAKRLGWRTFHPHDSSHSDR